MLVFLLWLGYSRRQDSNLKRPEREAIRVNPATLAKEQSSEEKSPEAVIAPEQFDTAVLF